MGVFSGLNGLLSCGMLDVFACMADVFAKTAHGRTAHRECGDQRGCDHQNG